MTADKTTTKAGRGKAGSGTPPKRRTREGDPHVSHALRSAYEETVREDVPPEFLELLGRLS